MKKATRQVFAIIFFFLVALFLLVLPISARPTSPGEAQTALLTWFKYDPNPLGAKMNRKIKVVRRCEWKDSEAVVYAVALDPQGFALVSSDDQIEPIIVFSPEGNFDPNEAGSPLVDLIKKDLGNRNHEIKLQTAETKMTSAQQGRVWLTKNKWQMLLRSSNQTIDTATSPGLSQMSDPRVDPLVKTKWSQTTVYDLDTQKYVTCYNYYTPKNYPCGCVATAFAQLMYYFQWPRTSIETKVFDIGIDGKDTTASLRGKDGFGGAYDWGNMPLAPNRQKVTLVQRQAIGALTYDAGVATKASYESSSTWGNPLNVGLNMRLFFGYSSASYGLIMADKTGPGNFQETVNSNLDAGLPVAVAIFGQTGHQVICDGYGYQSSSIYYHLNMGWGGEDDLWYNLPTFEASYLFTSAICSTFNVYPTGGAGQIISGRVKNTHGDLLVGTTVTVQMVSTGQTWNDTTDSHGIYAVKQVPANSTYTVTVAGLGTKTVATGMDTAYCDYSGNVWGVNFPADLPTVKPILSSAKGWEAYE